MDTALLGLLDMVVNYVESRKGSSSNTGTSSAPKPTATAATGDRSTEADQQHKEEVVRSAPAVKFLTRTDFFSLVQYNDVSNYHHIILTLPPA